MREARVNHALVSGKMWPRLYVHQERVSPRRPLSSCILQYRQSGHRVIHFITSPGHGMIGIIVMKLTIASQVAEEILARCSEARQAGNRTREERENMCEGKIGMIVLTLDGSLSVTDSTTGDLVAVDMADNEFLWDD